MKDNSITVRHLLYPLSLMAMTVFLLLAFQMTQIMREHDALITARASQEKGVEDSQKIQAQLVALIVGTQKLATDGNENAKKIVDRLKQLGIIPQPQQQAQPMGAEPVSPAAMPATMEAPAKNLPVKP